MIQRFELQLHDGTFNGDLAGMLEIDGDAVADDGLDLAETPFGLVGMAHQRANFQQFVHSGAATAPR